MCRRGSKLFWNLTWIALSLSLSMGAGAATKVGNGDDGSDLEGARAVESGPIVRAKERALQKVRFLHVEGINGLGNLIPELETSKILRAQRDVNSSSSGDQGVFHSDMRGLVFARTFAEPHAATRFFPVAEKLTEDQLVALHIHEALHRALPSDIRENESVVSSITMALAADDATHDRARSILARYIPENEQPYLVPTGMGTASVLASTAKYPINKDSTFLRPSLLAYSYRSFVANNDIQVSRLNSMHVLQSFLYPFGSDENPIGLGIEASLLNQDTGTEMGPLSLSGRMRLWSTRGFDIGAWAVASLNTLSAAEVKNTAYGRDVYSLGLSARKEGAHYFVENLIGLALPGESSQTLGSIKTDYSYGSVITANVRSGYKWHDFQVGGFGQFDLADYFRVSSPAFPFDSGRFYIVSGGPEVAYRFSDFTLTVYGRFILSQTKDANFDYLGNIIGQGTGQKSFGASLALNL